MIPPLLLRSFARTLCIPLLALAIPYAASGQPVATGLPELAPEARARLTQAAGDPGLPAWQREFMRRMARGDADGTESRAAPAMERERSRGATAEDSAGWALMFPPGGRSGHTAIYDPVRERMVIFGGSDRYHWLKDTWTLSLSGTPAWSKLDVGGTLPAARNGHSAIYDPVRDRMIIFGSFGYGNDVWALTLSGTPAWSEWAPAGTLPVWRYSHSAVYDPVRDRMIVYGGATQDMFGTTQDLDEVWALTLSDMPEWIQLAPLGTPPTARRSHGAIYDPVGDRMIVFGGVHGVRSALGDVWELSLSGTPQWTEITPPGPSPGPRWVGGSAVYDPVGGRMVVYGGGYYDSVTHVLDDVWALALSATPTWSEIASGGTPPDPGAGSVIFDIPRGRLVTYGGYCRSGQAHYISAVHALTLSGSPAWDEITPGGRPPGPRSGHSTAYDSARERMIVFGGFAYDTTWHEFGDAWALALSGTPAWSQLSPTGTPPCPRDGHSAIYDPVRERIVVFGGYGYDAGWHALGDVWALTLSGTPGWVQLAPTGTSPGPRHGHGAIYDPTGDRMIVFGGQPYTSDVWALSLEEPTQWNVLAPTGPPPAGRRGHTVAYDPIAHRMLVFGGYFADEADHYLNDVWALDLSGATAWSLLAPTGAAPSVRDGAAAVYDPGNGRMLVFGGEYWDGVNVYDYNDVWALELAGTPAWSQLAPAGTLPAARCKHGTTYDPVHGRMVVFGGSGATSYLDDTWYLGWSTTAGVDDPEPWPLTSGLRPPAPNPARGTTSVSYTIARAGRVRLDVHDLSGRLVRRLVDGERRAGSETVAWDGADGSGSRLRAGVYFVRLAGPGIHETRRVVLLR